MAAFDFSFEIAPGIPVFTVPADDDWTEVDPKPESIAWVIASLNDKRADTAGGKARFKDNERNLDPEYSSGPYYPDLTNWLHARIRLSHDGGAAQTVFTGYVPEWPISEETARNVVAPVLQSGIAAMNRDVPQPLIHEVYDTGGTIWALDTDGLQIASSCCQFNGEWVTHPEVASGALIQTERGYTQFNGSFTGRIKVTAFTPPSALPHLAQFTAAFTGEETGVYELFASSDGSNYIVLAADYDADTDLIKIVGWSSLKSGSAIETVPVLRADWETAHHIVLRCTSSDYQLWIDGELQTTNTVTAPSAPGVKGTWLGGGTSASRKNWVGAGANAAVHKVDLGAAGIASMWAAVEGFPGDRVGERINRILDAKGWPDGLRDISTGLVTCTSWDHTGKPIPGELALLADTEGGRLWFDPDGVLVFNDRHHAIDEAASVAATFSDDGDDIRYLTAGRNKRWSSIINVTTVEARSTVHSVRYIDVASRERFEEQPPRGDKFQVLADEVELLSIASTRVHEHLEPRVEVEGITFKPSADRAALVDMILARRVGDRLLFERTPQAIGTEWTTELEAVSYKHSLTTTDWDVEVRGVQAREADGWWSPGTSMIGVDSRWAP